MRGCGVGAGVGIVAFSRSPGSQCVLQRFIRQLNRASWNVRGGASLHCSPGGSSGNGLSAYQEKMSNNAVPSHVMTSDSQPTV